MWLVSSATVYEELEHCSQLSFSSTILGNDLFLFSDLSSLKKFLCFRNLNGVLVQNFNS